ncbi:MAG: Hsp70 family protein [Burkholderiales bacterium]|nr:Hsp70 family protein [Burkholderiales bacterium]
MPAAPVAASGYCAIDFGTSNSAIAIPEAGSSRTMRLIELEPGYRTMPTAVFYAAEGGLHEQPQCEFGRAAVSAYVDGIEGRLMRSMKSILGSTLVEQTTDIGGGRAVRFLDVVATYLAHLRRRAEAETGQPIARAVLGRPVFFVDDDPKRDAQAERALRTAAQRAGFREVEFQYEPIAAAFDYEQGVRGEERVLVADIGGGTSDFSIVRVGPGRAEKAERKSDILANHGVHIAGTDFDRRVELASVLPLFGYRAFGVAGADQPAREVPSAVYFDLATWHLINTVYNPLRVAELRSMRSFYADPAQHRRLMSVVDQRLGHELLARAEGAKIAVADGGTTAIALDPVEAGLSGTFDESQARAALDADLERIVAAARETAAQAGLGVGEIDALYFTGGSTGLRLLAERLQQAFPAARPVRGDRFASVATGLGLHAARRFGAPR